MSRAFLGVGKSVTAAIASGLASNPSQVTTKPKNFVFDRRNLPLFGTTVTPASIDLSSATPPALNPARGPLPSWRTSRCGQTLNPPLPP